MPREHNTNRTPVVRTRRSRLHPEDASATKSTRSKPKPNTLRTQTQYHSATAVAASSRLLQSASTRPGATSPAPGSMLARRQRLAAAMARKLAPVMRKGDSAAMRLEFARTMRGYLRDVSSCLSLHNGRMQLLSKQGIPVVDFDQRIGSESAYGMAYLSKGYTGLAKHLRFSAKLMRDMEEHAMEVQLLRRMSALVEMGVTPNMPMVYKAMRCDVACAPQSACPKVTVQGGYHIVLNELADSDMNAWLLRSYSNVEYASVVMQMILAIYAFHRQLGHVHNDCHMGNFLVHKVKPGGYWTYLVAGYTVHVPNMGHQLVMWDPGRAWAPEHPSRELAYEHAMEDYRRALGVLLSVGLLPHKLLENMIKPLKAMFTEHVITNEPSRMGTLMLFIKWGLQPCPGVIVGKPLPKGAHACNSQPYNLDAKLDAKKARKWWQWW